jgi:hypothetical protein
LEAVAARDVAPWVGRWVADARGDVVHGPYLERWRRALRDGGALDTALLAGRGVARVVAGPGYYRAVLDTAPLLSLIVSDQDRVIGLEWTTCLSCDEPRRFVLDLIEDVRQQGVLGSRLQPGLEISLEGSAAPFGGREEHWAALLAARLSVSQDIATMIGGALVVDQAGDVLKLRYPDGGTDTWQVHHTPRGWSVVYDMLDENSPLRLRSTEARRWRRLTRQQDVAQASWHPSWATVDGGTGLVVGHHAVGAFFGAEPDVLLIVVMDLDRAHSAVFEVNALSREVLRRWELPVDAQPGELRVGPWYPRWPAALSQDRGTLLIAAPDELWLLELRSGELQSLAEESELAAVGFAEDGRPFWATLEGQLFLQDASLWQLDLESPALSVQVLGDEVTALLTDGRLVGWSLTTEQGTGSRTVCGGHPAGATPNPRNDAWLIGCNLAAPYGFEIAAGLAGTAEAFERRGSVHGPTAWSSDGRQMAVAAPPDEGEAVAVWDVMRAVPLLTIGHVPAISLAFSDDGDQLLAVTENGDVLLWNLPQARRQNPVLGPRRPFPPAD